MPRNYPQPDNSSQYPGLFPEVDMLAQAVSAERAEDAQKHQQRMEYLAAIGRQTQQRQEALNEQRERNRLERRDRIDAYKEETARRKQMLDEQNFNFKQHKYSQSQQWKMIVDIRNRIEHRAMMALTAARDVYAAADKYGFAAVKNNLKSAVNAFPAANMLLDAWDRQPAFRNMQITPGTHPGDNAAFNIVFKDPAMKALLPKDKNAENMVLNALYHYASLPADQRAGYRQKLQEQWSQAHSANALTDMFTDVNQAEQYLKHRQDAINTQINSLYDAMPGFNRGVAPPSSPSRPSPGSPPAPTRQGPVASTGGTGLEDDTEPQDNTQNNDMFKQIAADNTQATANAEQNEDEDDNSTSPEAT